MRIAHATSISLALACPLAACSDEPEAPIYTCMDAEVHEHVQTPRPDYPLVWQTEHLDIYAKDDLTVCAGTAAEFERHVLFVADTLGIEPREHIPLYMSAEPPTQECNNTSAGGCSTRDGVTFSAPTATYHELTHAVACQLRMVQTPALAEGLAEAFLPRRTGLYNYGDADLREALHADANEFTYRIYDLPPHFIRWLIETRGGESVARVYRIAPAGYSYFAKFDGEKIIAAFEDVYQTDFDTLEGDFWQTSPGFAWPPYRQCADILHVDSDQIGEWRYESTFDCNSETTFGPYERVNSSDSLSYNGGMMIHQSFTIEITKAATYEIDYEGAERVKLERCSTEPADTIEEARMLYDRALAVEPHNNKVDLSPGIWRLDVLRDYGDPAPVEVLVREYVEDES